MFVATFRKKGIQKVVALGASAIILIGAGLGVNSLLHGTKVKEAAALSTGLTQTITGADTMAVYLQGFGITVDVTGATVDTVTIPRSWDDSFKAFNEVVKKSGLDLKKFKNKQVDKWMALVPDKSDETRKIYAVVLVSKEKPIGIYLLQKPSGDVLPIEKVTQTVAPLTEEELAANANFGEAASDTAVNAGAVSEAAANAGATSEVPVNVAADAPLDSTAFPIE